jgi:hypothetical protein
MNASIRVSAIAVAVSVPLFLLPLHSVHAIANQAPAPALSPSPSPTAPASPQPPTISVDSEAEKATAMAAPPESATPLTKEMPEWMRGVTLGAGATLWYYQPIMPRSPGVKNNVSVFWAHLLVDGKWGPIGFHLEPRFRDTPLRTVATTTNGVTFTSYTQDDRAWLQEAYASIDLDAIGATLKLGKEYSHLGYFWDNSFYGNVQVYDGLKLDPDYGLSLEGNVGKSKDAVSVGWWAQYFVVDGSTNVSLAGRDTISVPGARRRNQGVLRLEPRLNFGDVNVTIGVSGEHFQADFPAPPISIDSQDVWRGALDASISLGGLKILGELQHQDGRHVTDFPFPSSAAGPGSSKSVDYAQAGAELTVGAVTARYQLSVGRYNDAPQPTGGTATVEQWLHVPAIGVAISPNLSVLGELVLWNHDTPTSSTLYDRSFNLTVYTHL